MSATTYEISTEVKNDLKETVKILFSLISRFPPSVKEAVYPLFESGGKMLRPLLLLLCARAGNLKANREKVLLAACCVEMLHVSSLIHDDVIDRADLRRGVPTVNHRYGCQKAISAGDFLFGRTFELVADLGDESVSAMAKAAQALSEGELAQIQMKGWAETTPMSYLRRIRLKTAVLFSVCCELGAVLTNQSAGLVKELASYGESLGMAFQILDDLLDVQGDPQETGKPVALDLRQGIVTLPVIYALEESNYDERIVKVIQGDSSEKAVKEALLVIKGTRGIERAKKEAKNYVKMATQVAEKIKDEQARLGLLFISKFVVERYY